MAAGPRLSGPRRYQLDKRSAAALAGGHPWVFRGRMSSAAAVFADGQWLRLVDGENRVVGFGVYEADGAIAIRILRRGAAPPDGAWVRAQVGAALERRRELRGRTDAFRALHGENDRLPGVVVDVFGGVAVLQTYSRGVDALGRLAAAEIRRALDLEAVVWKPPRLRRGGARPARVLSGRLPGPVRVREEGMEFWVDPLAGQKSGAFLDLRGLRRLVRGLDLAGARVLDLFSYTGTLGLAAEHAGSAEVVHVDASGEALRFGAEHHELGRATARWVEADVFAWLRSPPVGDPFELVIVDPPQMTSRVSGVPRALASYRRLYRAVAPRVAPGGLLAACCCTSRIRPQEFARTVARALGGEFRLERELPQEPDHPVAFPEGRYLKVLVFRRDR